LLPPFGDARQRGVLVRNPARTRGGTARPKGRGRARTRVAVWHNPCRPLRFLIAIAIGYLLWSLLPVLIAVLYSFNAGRSRTTWQGFSTRWYWGDQTLSVWHNDALHTALLQTLKLGLIATLITVPLGTLFAIGIDRWRGRLPNGANFLMLLSFVLPEVLLAVALLFVI